MIVCHYTGMGKVMVSHVICQCPLWVIILTVLRVLSGGHFTLGMKCVMIPACPVDAGLRLPVADAGHDAGVIVRCGAVQWPLPWVCGSLYWRAGSLYWRAGSLYWRAGWLCDMGREAVDLHISLLIVIIC